MGGPSPHTISVTVTALLEEGQRSERAGQRELARRRYESALYFLRGSSGSVAASLFRRVARTYIDDGNFDAGLDCLEVAQATAEALEDIADIAHAVNLMAIANVHRGDLDAAERLYVRTQALAHTAGDDRLGAMVSQGRGVIAATRGDSFAALEHYTAAVEVYRRLGLDEYIGLVINNMAMAHMKLGHFDEASAAYQEALEHCARVGDTASRLMVQVNLTELLLHRGDLDGADALCAQVLEAASGAGDQRALGEAHKHRGTIARRRGDYASAERDLATAFASAVSREDLLLGGETAREQAELFEATGRSRETLQALTRAHRMFTKLRAGLDLSDLAERVGRLETRFYDVVHVWAQTIESKDVHTLGHCERVAEYACALARETGMDELTLFWFRIGALLHDVGKIVVPVEILNKPGPLDPQEREIMERHAAAGSDLLRDVDFPWDVLPMVRGHHERWDGTGYPDRLAGENIPRTARLLCVADVFDALTSDRPYRKAFSREDALALMSAQEGRLFDPELFGIFESMIRSAPRQVLARASETVIS
jgi:putative nucleotidyltransferase with HDIG domain